MKQIIGNKREIKRIAEAYVKAKDDLPGISESECKQLRHVISVMFASISERIHFDFVKKDPYDYTTVGPMLEDYVWNHSIKVNVSGNNSKMWGPVYNLMFRAIHDYVHARWNYDFNYKDEILAHEKQIWLTQDKLKWFDYDNPLWELYYKILRSEIIYQAAYKTHFGEFHVPVQKIILKDL